MSTATVPDDTPLGPDDELLVAYLDGELDRKSRDELENRLMEDSVLRKRLQELQSGWDLLDDLPDPAPSLKLVESTLELAVADIIQNEPSTETVWSRLRLPLLVGAISIAGIVASFVVAATMRSQEYDRQLRDLAIVEHLDAYNHGSDLTLMRELSADSDWSAMVSAASEIGDIQNVSIADVQSMPIEDRESQIQQLPIVTIAQLDSRWDRFARMDDANRDRIRRTADAVALQSDAETLLQTMQAYAIWRENLSTELRDQIESGVGKVRRDAIDDAIEQTRISITRRSSLQLDEETIDWIYFALRQIVSQRIEAGDEPTIRQVERFKGFGGSDNSEYGTIAAIVFSGESRSGRRFGFSRPPGGGEPLSPLQPGELESIRLVLPSSALDILGLVAASDPLKETATLQVWASEAVRRKSPFKREESTLLERYLEKPESDRDAIDLMPPKEILEELQRDSWRSRG